MSLTPYSPGKNHLVIAGLTMHGFDAGTFIEIEATEDTMSHVVGADGEIAMVESLNPTGMLTMTLLQTSQSNSYLASLCAAKTIFSMALFETNAPQNEDVRAQSERCYVMRQAKTVRGKELQSMEWKIALLDLKQFSGGLDDGTV